MEWFTESVIVQIIATVGAILVALIPAYFGLKHKLNQVGEDAKEARNQTSNDHSDNLRDELDQRHEVIMTTLQELGKDMHGLRIDHLATRKDIGQLRGDDREARRETAELREILQHHIEDTAHYIPAIKAIVRTYLEEKRQRRLDAEQDLDES